MNSMSGPQGGCDKASEGGEGLIYHLFISATGTPDRGLGRSLIWSMAAVKRMLLLIELLVDNELPHPVALLCITLAQNIEFLTKQTNKPKDLGFPVIATELSFLRIRSPWFPPC